MGRFQVFEAIDVHYFCLHPNNSPIEQVSVVIPILQTEKTEAEGMWHA